MSELLVVVVVLCHSRVLGLSSNVILRTNDNGSHLVLKHTKDPATGGICIDGLCHIDIYTKQ